MFSKMWSTAIVDDQAPLRTAKTMTAKNVAFGTIALRREMCMPLE
jgi:hypothetical protein